MKTTYVLGFFHNSEQFLGVIKKKGPKQNIGKVNGIGGKVDDGEDILDAMRREFLEETGLTCPDWRYLGRAYGSDWQMHIFSHRTYVVDLHDFNIPDTNDIGEYLDIFPIFDFNVRAQNVETYLMHAISGIGVLEVVI